MIKTSENGQNNSKLKILRRVESRGLTRWAMEGLETVITNQPEGSVSIVL